MSRSKLLVPDAKVAPKEARSGSATTIWVWMGVLFLVVGGADFLLTWIPADFGNAEWEFGTVTASLNGLPVPVLGLTLMLVGAVAGERGWPAALVFLTGILALLVLLGGALLWAMTAPQAVQTVPDAIRLGLYKALAKTGVQLVAYMSAFAFLVRRAFLHLWPR